jgi:peptidyl-prolyl cis-trans isomerase A (cyclophilin A)
MKNLAILILMLMALVLGGCGTGEQKAEKKAEPEPAGRKLDDPSPAVYRVAFETSKGNFVVEVNRDWAPRGADRFYTLVDQKFFDDSRFFRVVRGFVVQFGISGRPGVNRYWNNMVILDDPVKASNKKGYVTFAMAGPASRTTQVFINLRDNSKTLDKSGFAPFGRVISGMDVVESLYYSYGDFPPGGSGPDPSMIESQGNDYLLTRFPRLDYIKTATFVETAQEPATGKP